ncbi:MAG: hypothetical protein ACYCZ1_01710, partial [Candidatus Humimicrobiaceae bacterium]
KTTKKGEILLKEKLKTKFTSGAVMILLIALTLSFFTFAGCKKSTSDSMSNTSEQQYCLD